MALAYKKLDAEKLGDYGSSLVDELLLSVLVSFVDLLTDLEPVGLKGLSGGLGLGSGGLGSGSELSVSLLLLLMSFWGLSPKGVKIGAYLIGISFF